MKKAIKIIVVTLLLLLLAVYITGFVIKYSCVDKTFESSKWKKANSEHRWQMYDDLLEKKILNGKTQKEVIEILGMPDSRQNETSDAYWEYDLESKGSMHPLLYFIEMGWFYEMRIYWKNGVVKDIELWD
jgi:hypothetical protein